MTKDAGFVGLTGSTDPDNVVALEWVLADTTGRGCYDGQLIHEFSRGVCVWK